MDRLTLHRILLPDRGRPENPPLALSDEEVRNRLREKLGLLDDLSGAAPGGMADDALDAADLRALA